MKKVKRVVSILTLTVLVSALFTSCADDDVLPTPIIEQELTSDSVSDATIDNDTRILMLSDSSTVSGTKVLATGESMWIYVGNKDTKEIAEARTLEWSSSNENVATLSNKNENKVEITAKSVGMATITAKDTKNDKTLLFYVNVISPQYYTDLTYTLSASPDLLEFVFPVVTFLAEEQEVEQCSIQNDEWIKPEPEDIDLGDGEIFHYIPNYRWDHTVHFTNLEINTKAIVIYKRYNSSIAERSYDFSHSIEWKSFSSKTQYGISIVTNNSISIDLNININVNGETIKTDNDGKILAESAELYLQYLEEHPDTLELFINEYGSVSSIK